MNKEKKNRLFISEKLDVVCITSCVYLDFFAVSLP